MRQLWQNVAAGQIFDIRDGALPRGGAITLAKRLEKAAPLPPIGCVPACLPSMSHDSSTTLGRPGFAIPRLSLPAGLLISLGLIAIAASIEHAMGRLFFCKCGTFKLWYGGRGGPEMSQHLTDWYSYSHVVHGIVFYGLLSIVARGRLSVAARLVIATGLEVSWEIFENTSFIINRYRAQTISRGYFGDSIVNSVGDMLSMLVGFLLAARLPAWVTVFLLIAAEVLLLALIRDNLTLNVIMLIHPMEWIKEWQMGG
jgi:hypothetical protein